MNHLIDRYNIVAEQKFKKIKILIQTMVFPISPELIYTAVKDAINYFNGIKAHRYLYGSL